MRRIERERESENKAKDFGLKVNCVSGLGSKLFIAFVARIWGIIIEFRLFGA